MSSRSYAQFCGLAAAMDVLGERWAVLVVRDLLAGPRRYTDLLKALPGISTDMLATRLSELERAGVVRRSVLPAPGAAKVYELTELGRALEPVLLGLARWGLHRLTTPEYAQAPVRREWVELALRSAYDPRRGPRHAQRVRFTVDDHVVVASVGPAGLQLDDEGDGGPGAEVDADVRGPSAAMVEVLTEPASAARLIRDGVITISGTPDAIEGLAAFRIDDRGP